MRQGWIKLHRKILDSSIWEEDPLCLKAFIWLFLSANHKPRKVYISNLRAEITVNRGEIVTSYRTWAESLKYRGMSSGQPWKTPTVRTMRTIRKHLEDAQMIAGLTTGGCLHLVIENYTLYQSSNEITTEETTGETTRERHENDTEQELRIKKKDIYGPEIEEIIDYLNSLTASSYRPTTRETIRLLSGRLSEGNTVEDCKLVVRHRWEKWQGDPKMVEFVRPSTLFRPSNFESYLQEARRCETEGRGDDGQPVHAITAGHIRQDLTSYLIRAAKGKMNFQKFGSAITERYKGQTVSPEAIQEAWELAHKEFGGKNG